jgi:hypothetical protein
MHSAAEIAGIARSAHSAHSQQRRRADNIQSEMRPLPCTHVIPTGPYEQTAGNVLLAWLRCALLRTAHGIRHLASRISHRSLGSRSLILHPPWPMALIPHPSSATHARAMLTANTHTGTQTRNRGNRKSRAPTEMALADRRSKCAQHLL